MKNNNIENVYEIYLQPDEPDACFVTKLLQWIQCMVQHNVRPLEDDDFVFPDIFIDDDDDDISLEKPCPIIQVTSLMNKYARDTGIDHGSRLDPHCFRRGGAQHRLAHNQNRWPFKAVKWWGGWTDEYSTQAVLAYILDDSTRTDFGDMMSPHRIQQGRDTIWRTANAVVLSEQLKMAVEALENSRAALAKIEKAGQKRHRKIEQGFKELRQEWAEMKKSIGQATPEVHLQDASNNVHFVQRPDLPRIQSWKDVIRQWYEGEPKRGLVVPLGEWPGAWRRGNPAFYNRSVIIKEFEYFGRDEDNMRGEYGDLLRGRVNDLVGEIRARRARRAKRAKRQTRRQGAPSPTPTGPETRRKRRLEEVEDREDDDYEEEEEDEEDADKEEESDSEEDDN